MNYDMANNFLCKKVSISSTFCTCVFRKKNLVPKITKVNCNYRKLRDSLKYKKGTCKMLIKLTIGVILSKIKNPLTMLNLMLMIQLI